MAERHTQGRVMAGTIPVTINNQLSQFHAVGIEATPTALALTGVVGDERDALSSADARRIAACWNACQGIPTEVLETLDVARALRIGDEWKAQRDRLEAVALLAREFIAVDLKDLVDSMTVNGVFEPDEQDRRAIAEYDAIIAQLDAAMAPAVVRLPADDTEGGAA